MSNLLRLKRANGSVVRFGQMAAMYAAAWIVLGISSAQAGLLMDSGSVQNASSRDSVFGLLTASDDIIGFPQANVLNTTGSSQNTVNYVFTQLGGVTTMAWSASGHQDGSSRAFSGNDSDLYFTPTTNQSFTWTSTWDAQSSLAITGYFALLFDQTDNTTVFDDDIQGNTFVANHSGLLIAGHQYELYSGSAILENLGSGPSSFTAEFNFTATEIAAVPEPTSLSIFCSVVGLVAFRFRRKS